MDAETYHLIRYYADGVIDVVSNSDITQTVTETESVHIYAKYYNGMTYRCKILHTSSNYDYLRCEEEDVKKRSRAMHQMCLKKTIGGNKEMCLIKFSVGEDFYICSEKDLKPVSKNKDCYYVYSKCGSALRQVMLYEKGVKNHLIRRYKELQRYEQSLTPEKIKTRNPTIPYTPRIVIPPVIRRSITQIKRNLANYYPGDESSSSNEAPYVASSDDKDPNFSLPKESIPLTTFPGHDISSSNKNVCTILDNDADSPTKYTTPSHSMSSPYAVSQDDTNTDLPLSQETRLQNSPSHSISSSNQDPYAASDNDKDPDFSPSKESTPQSSPSHSISSNKDDYAVSQNDPLTNFPGHDISSSKNDFSTILDNDKDPPTKHTTPPWGSSPHSISSSYAVSQDDTDPDFSLSKETLLRNFPSHKEDSDFSPSKESPLLQSFPSNRISSSNKDLNDVQQSRNKGSTTNKDSVRLKHACIFCGQLGTNMPRHLRTVHQDHPKIIEILSLTDSKEQTKQIAKLRREGTYLHNSKVLTEGKGYFIPQRRNHGKSPDKYLPCTKCRQYYLAASLHKHVRKCNVEHIRYSRVQSSASLALPNILPHFKQNGRGFQILKEQVLPTMNNDMLTSIAKRDALIIRWGSVYCSLRLMKKRKRYLNVVASQRMRLLARLLLQFKRQYGVCSLTECLDPQNFDNLIETVRQLSGEQDGIFKTPSIPCNLGHILFSCAIILKNEGNRRANKKIITKAKAFISLYTAEWNTLLSSRARDQMKEARYSKRNVRLLPLAEDIIQFYKYLCAEETRLVKSLSKGFSITVWCSLAKVLMTSLLLFNRKRVGDIQRIPLSAYINHTTIQNSDINITLNDIERTIANGYVHMYTVGKKDRMVPVMLAKNQIPSYNLMIKYRTQAGVSEDNEFLFGRGQYSYFNGNAAMRCLSANSGAKHHTLLRSTALRKHIATMCQVLNLEQGELDIIANYMGHNIDVHRRFYRIPEEGLHLSRLTRLLNAVSTGDIEAIKGRGLDDLPLPNSSSSINYVFPKDKSTNDEDESTEGRDQSMEGEDEEENRERFETICGTKKKHFRTVWTNEDKEAVTTWFSKEINTQSLPGKGAITACQSTHVNLKKRPWTTIKDFVRNLIRKNSKS